MVGGCDSEITFEDVESGVVVVSGVKVSEEDAVAWSSFPDWFSPGNHGMPMPDKMLDILRTNTWDYPA